MFLCENSIMLPDFNYILQCMKNNHLVILECFIYILLCCLQRRDAWPWQEMTIFEPAVIAYVKKPSRDVM